MAPSIDCGSACLNCEIPIRLDTYKGCSHACAYCFNRRFRDISKITPRKCVGELRNFISGKRNVYTNWCDWDIPLHWGGNSDPFQPCEEEYGISYKCLEVFAETKYPFVVSTKGRLLATPKYLDVLKECDCVVQISMTSPKLDRFEEGAPTFEERLKMIEKIRPNCRRLIVRMQPYIIEARQDVLDELPVLKDLGVHGVILEGMRFYKKAKGLEKVGSNYLYPLKILASDFTKIWEKAHEVGLKFYCGEPDLRFMSDDLCCCGVGDIYRTNKVTTERMYQGLPLEFTEKQQEVGTALCFRAFRMNTKWGELCKKSSYKEMFFKTVSERG